MFRILSNSLDEARAGYGTRIVSRSMRISPSRCQDFGRGVPVDYNQKEQRYNWELIFCELYAGGKYDTDDYTLGLNGLGACATQYASEYMDVEVRRDGFLYTLHFEHGENVGGLKKEPYAKKDTGTRIRFKPDIQVFTDITVPQEYFVDTLRRQAIVNPGLLFHFRRQQGRSYEEQDYQYENGHWPTMCGRWPAKTR